MTDKELTARIEAVNEDMTDGLARFRDSMVWFSEGGVPTVQQGPVDIINESLLTWGEKKREQILAEIGRLEMELAEARTVAKQSAHEWRLMLRDYARIAGILSKAGIELPEELGAKCESCAAPTPLQDCEGVPICADCKAEIQNAADAEALRALAAVVSAMNVVVEIRKNQNGTQVTVFENAPPHIKVGEASSETIAGAIMDAISKAQA